MSFWKLVNPGVRALAGIAPWWVVLETTGRSSGEARQIPLAKGPIDGDVAWLIAVHGEHSSFAHNISANPQVRLKLNGNWRPGIASLAPYDPATVARFSVYARTGPMKLGIEPKLIRIELDQAPSSLAQAKGSRISGSSSDGSALIRAVAAGEPDPALRCPDLLARDFVADVLAARLGDTRPGLRFGRWLTERRLPGAYWYEIARVKHFDSLLLAALSRGISQVVILGAGLDSRPYRFAAQLATARVFEVDHPVTSARKRERLIDALGAVPQNVTYVETDLKEDDLAEQLFRHGFDPAAMTFVLWCGVTMYLDRPTVEAVLGWTAGLPAGSSIAFDYDFEDFIAGEDRFHGAAQIRRYLERGGERLTFGLDPEELAEPLGRHRLTLASNVLSEELGERYLRRSDGTVAGRPYGFMGIAEARVGGG